MKHDQSFGFVKYSEQQTNSFQNLITFELAKVKSNL